MLSLFICDIDIYIDIYTIFININHRHTALFIAHALIYTMASNASPSVPREGRKPRQEVGTYVTEYGTPQT